MEEPKALVLVAAFETTFCPFPFPALLPPSTLEPRSKEKKNDSVSFLEGG